MVHGESSEITRKQIFDFALTTNMQPAELGPGDAYSVSPVIKSISTEDMYVFIKLITPQYENGSLYSFDVDPTWTLVSSSYGEFVYAYGQDEMYTLAPGEDTIALTTGMTMLNIPVEVFAQLDDVNIQVIGYAIGVENVNKDPATAWEICKEVGNLE